MFSSRLPPRLEPNAFSRALALARADGRVLLDLTQTNPTAIGLPYPPGVVSSLADPRGATYAPDPRGLRPAREAIVAAMDPAAGVTADRVILTASTSEAYGFLFKLLCDPGTTVLVPQPGYPLFDLLTALEAVRARPYRLEYHGAWSIDRASVEAAIGSDVRAILVVSPNNPTGSRLRRDDRDWLVDLAARRGIALVADEVFGEYPLATRPDAVSLLGERRALTFTLGGLSKSAGLPQLKLAWIAVSGPDAVVAAALERLDVIADTYLSVSTPVQLAAAALIEAGRAVRLAVADRLRDNLAALRAALVPRPEVALLEPEAGWSAVLRVPATASEEALILRALRHGVVVQPGYFYDFATEAYLVISLLPARETFDAGVAALLRALAEGGA
ncbi:MAG: pyridoxal phosphate-dependent aminotransferase [Vicinamibacterales bacterium]